MFDHTVICVNSIFVFLVEKMVEMGKEMLQKNNVTDLNDVR